MTISDLTMFTFNNHVGKIQPLVDDFAGNASLQYDDLLALYFAINGSFLLNPSHDAASPFASMTPLDVVESRRPKRLLVNIGINDGIWEVCLSAKSAIDSAAMTAAPITSSGQSAASRRITFSSSRTLPGQPCCRKRSTAP